ncbi:MAG: FkbM family methyltransferase [Chthoniobacteraceae bacterium]
MSAFAARFNRLPVWHRRLRVWGADFRACSLDRLVYLTLHRLGFMGRDERVFFQSHIQPGMNVAEAGANIGVYTIQLSRLVGPEGRVFAFEPDPHLFACLRENLDRAGITNVEPHHCALGSAPGKLSLAWDGLNSGDTHLSREAQPGAAQVDVARLDTVLAGKRVDFFKLDVQGWELEVLRGMTGLFDANPALRLFIEYWPAGLRRAGTEPGALLDFLREHRWQLTYGPDFTPIPAGQFAKWDTSTEFVNLNATRR